MSQEFLQIDLKNINYKNREHSNYIMKVLLLNNVKKLNNKFIVKSLQVCDLEYFERHWAFTQTFKKNYLLFFTFLMFLYFLNFEVSLLKSKKIKNSYRFNILSVNNNSLLINNN